MIPIGCRLYLDGVHFPSTPADAANRRPVALEPLTIEWGRETGTEQPDVSTCSVVLRVYDPPDDILAVAHVGTRLDVEAVATLPGAIPGPPTVDGVNHATNPAAETNSLTAWTSASSTAYVLTVDAASPVAGAYSILATRQAANPGTAYASIALLDPGNPGNGYRLPPTGPPIMFSLDVRPELPARIFAQVQWFDAAGAAIAVTPGADLAVDVAAGETRRVAYTETATPPPTAVTVRGRVAVFTADGTTAPAGARVWFDRLLWGTGGAYFDGDTPTDATHSYRWTGAPSASTSERVTLGDYLRAVPVYAGAVSDLQWAAAGADAVDLALIAVDVTGPLGNRPVGDEPWPVHTVAQRVDRILDLAGLPVAHAVDPGVAGLRLSGRDVDAQPAADLLRDIAQSAGAVLWTTTDDAGGDVLWLEDPATRAAVRVLTETGDGTVIIDNPRNPGGDVTVLSACDLLRDPVQWTQAAADVTTTVDVTWLEQTLGDDGALDPTERHVLLTNPAAEAVYGVNRLAVATELVDPVDAEALATTLLDATSTLFWRVDGVVYDTGLVADHLPGVDDTIRIDAVLDLLDLTRRPGLAVTLTELPGYAPITGDTTGAYLEGGSYTYSADAWQLDLNLSPSPAAAANSATWQDLDPGWLWSEFDPDITWHALSGVGVAP